MTEDEAKTKWCPHVRLQHSDEPASNRYRDDWIGGCIGSQCMAWRWASEKNEAYVPPSPMMSPKPVHPADMQSPWRKSTTEGYCGLAGQP